MENMLLLYLVICEFNLDTFVVFAKHEQYDGHSLYQVNVNNPQEVEIINNLVNHLYLDEWSRAVPGSPGHILVPKESKEVFEISLNAGGIKYEIKVDNIKDALKLEDQRQLSAARNQRHKSHRTGFEISFQVTYTYDEVNDYLKYLANSSSFVENVNGGNSFEGRPINYLKISTTNFKDNKKPIVMLQSLVHGREWTTLPVTLYASHNLVTRAESDLLNDIDWIIVPVVNPDGYIYSHETNRMWRKNRRTDGDLCPGVDLNRNFNVAWGINANDNTCSEDFHGIDAESEPETQVIANIIRTYKNRIALFLDFHSYGSKILFGYGDGTLPPNYYTLKDVAVLMSEAMNKVQLSSYASYTVGNIERVLFTVSGCVSDYAQKVGVPLSYSIELPDIEGFFVDHETLEHTCFETWQAILAGARYILNNTDLIQTSTKLTKPK